VPTLCRSFHTLASTIRCLYGERVARARREWLEGSIYHVFARGSNRQAIYLNEGDYVEFDMLLAAAIRKERLETFGWSLMPNHWHGLFRCPGAGLSRFMQRLNHRYALRFDRRWGRTAHVFDNRFGAVLQKTEQQFLWTLRYVVRNPVESGLCASPFDARWTSFRPTAGLAPAPEYLRVDDILEHFGPDPLTARQRFVDFVVGEEPAGLEPAGLEPGSDPSDGSLSHVGFAA
jgi:putative transposase